MIKILLLSALLFWGCQSSSNAKKSSSRPAAQATGKPVVNTTMRNPATDARDACTRGDYRLWALKDVTDDIWVTPAASRLAVQNQGYTFESRPLVDNLAAATTEEAHKYYRYAETYNEAVLAQMHQKPRGTRPAPRQPDPVSPMYDDIPAPAPEPKADFMPRPAEPSTVNKQEFYSK